MSAPADANISKIVFVRHSGFLCGPTTHDGSFLTASQHPTIVNFSRVCTYLASQFGLHLVGFVLLQNGKQPNVQGGLHVVGARAPVQMSCAIPVLGSKTDIPKADSVGTGYIRRAK